MLKSGARLNPSPRTRPFDAIFINAGATEVRASWLDQLRLGGRLLVPLTVALPAGELGAGHMLLIRNHGNGYAARFVMPVGIFHCTGARTEEGDARLRAAFPRGVDSVRSLRRDAHDPGPECWLHADTFCLSSKPLDLAGLVRNGAERTPHRPPKR
jgi:protein-L-isoaspartate(D-aspartate) O-methyltransferase